MGLYVVGGGGWEMRVLCGEYVKERKKGRKKERKGDGDGKKEEEKKRE